MEISNYSITIGNATDVGKIRDHNEDYMAHFDTSMGYCIVVCDGMGGHAAGDVASQNAVDSIKHFLQNGKITKLDIPSSLHNAIEFANYKLREMVLQKPALKGMGTTCVMALINNAEMNVAHAGDSRLYLIRDKDIQQISKDHSTVQKLIDSGALTVEEAEQSDKKNQITKAIGIFEKVEPTVTEAAIPLRKNDKILLCSDGLTAHVSKEKILETVLSEKNIQNATLKLIALANEGGGTDNITVQIVHYTGKSSEVKAKKKRPLKKYLLITVLLIIAIIIGFFCYKNIISPGNKKAQTQDSTKTESNIEGKDTSKREIINVENPAHKKNIEEKSISKEDKVQNEKQAIKKDSLNKHNTK